MKTYLDCIPCFFRQAITAGRVTGADEARMKAILDEVARMIPELPLEMPPPLIADSMYRRIRHLTREPDPYLALKRESIETALALLPAMRHHMRQSSDPLMTAIRVAIAGNVIDVGVHKEYDIERDLYRILEQEFAILDYAPFVEHLSRARSVLYLGDNAGESVFDRLLIEAMGKPVTYAVRSAPVLNDQTVEDAIASGLDQVARIIESGSTAPATILSQCTPEFLALFESADLVISKGQGNYEGLSEVDRPVFFFLKAKCSVIARDLAVPEDSIVMKAINA